MTLSPLQLAAIVSAGVPGIYPVATAAAPEESAEYDTAIITDSADRNWRVRAPRNHDASMRLEAEHQVLRSFTHGLRARLPFTVPTIAGTVPYNGMSVFVYTYVPGTHRDLEELARIIDGVTYNEHLSVTFDTCHVHDAGYDIKNDLSGVLTQFDKTVGLDRIKVLHINDSKNPVGAHKDRHENFGFGEIGFDALMNVIQVPEFKNLPKILETPWIKVKDKVQIAPYKKEIEMIRSGKFDSHWIEELLNQERRK